MNEPAEPIEPHDDVMQAHAEREAAQTDEMLIAEAMRELEEDEAQQAQAAAQGPAGAAPTEGAGGDESPAQPTQGAMGAPITGEQFPGAMDRAASAGEAIGGVMHSLAPYPSQVAGGALEVLEQAPAALRDLSEWITETIGLPTDAGLVFGGDDWVSIKSGDEYEEVAVRNQMVEAVEAVVPDIDRREDGGGDMARGIAQFLTGFALTRGMPGTAALAKAGTAGQFSAAALRGAVADFASFDPHEERLSNLVQSYEPLQNPVSEYLAAAPDDTEAEGRFKNALEGLGLGAVVEGLFRGVKAIRAARLAKEVSSEPLEQAARDIEILDETVDIQKQRFEELLGDPEAPTFDITPAVMSADEIIESGATGAGRAGAAAARGAKGEEGAEFVVNWARMDTTDDVKAIIQDLANASKEEIDAVRGPKMRFNEVAAEAAEIDAFEVLKSRREMKEGAALPPKEATALRALFVNSGRKVRDLAAQLRAEPDSDIAKIAFRKMLSVHNLIQAEALADQAAAARTFAARRIPVGDTPEFMGQMEELTRLYASDSTSLDIADRILKGYELGKPEAVEAFMYGTPWAKTQDGIAQLWYLSLLSGPHTHARNFISNTTVMPLQMLERGVAARLSALAGDGAIADDEAAQMFFGMFQGLRDAFRISKHGRDALAQAMERPGTDGARIIAENADEFGGFWRSAVTGDSGFGTGKVDPRAMGAFDPEKWGLAQESPMHSVFSVIDTATSMPTRALTAGDEIFKTANYTMELRALAARKVTAEVRAGRLSPDDYLDEVTRLVNEPDKAMRIKAQEFAAEATFTNDPPRNSKIHQMMRGVAGVPVLGRMAMAFVRTPYNIGRFAFRRTPVALAMQSYQRDVMEGGAKAHLARAQMLTGTGILAVSADLAFQGFITGEGPPDREERAHLMRQGWKPNSIAIGTDEKGKPNYISYRGLEPLAASLGMAANTVEILAAMDADEDADADELVMATSLAIANQLTAANYMQGVSEMLEAMGDPNRYGENYLNRLAGRVIPQGVATVTFADDPIMREVRDWQDAIRARTPGLSEDLPARRDLHGRPITRESPFGKTYDIFSPLYASKFDPEPIDEEWGRLELYPANMKRSQRFDGIEVDLDKFPGAYSRLVELAGKELELTPGTSRGQYVSDGGGRLAELNSLATGTHSLSGWYGMLTREAQIAMHRSILSVYNAAARDALLEEYPELKSHVDQELVEQSLEDYGVELDPESVRAMR